MKSDAGREPDHLLKIVVIGDHCICKTRSYFTLCEETYSLDDQLITLGIDFRVRRLALDSKLVKVQVWYPTGGERFRTILPSYFRGTHGFVVVYDSADPKTLQKLDDWLQEIEKSGPLNTEKLFIGGCCDYTKTEGVTLSEVEEFAAARSIPLIELDHDRLEKVEESFQTMVRAIIQNLPPNDSSEQPTCGKKTTCSFL